MRIVIVGILVTVCASPAVVRAQDAAAVAPARASVDAWLALVDARSYGETWKTAASYFRGAITQERWEQALQGVRTPLGQLKKRQLTGSKTTKSVPGAPDGEYVVFQFDTSYEHKASAVETVTAMKDKDGAWRVAGYFIK